METWFDLFHQLEEESGEKIFTKVSRFMKKIKKQDEVFVRRQYYKLKLFLNDLNNNTLDIETFEELVIDIRDLSDIRILQLPIYRKPAVEILINGINEIFLMRFIPLMKRTQNEKVALQ